MPYTKLDETDRKTLFDLYIQLQECKNEIEHLIHGTMGYQAAKAYWYAELSVAISDEEYCTNNPTFQSFLRDENIINKNDEFIESNDDEEEDDDEDEEEEDGEESEDNWQELKANRD